MGIQDTYYDIRATLEGKPEAELFEEFSTWAFNMEAAIDVLNQSGPTLVLSNGTYIRNDVVRAIIGKADEQ